MSSRKQQPQITSKEEFLLSKARLESLAFSFGLICEVLLIMKSTWRVAAQRNFQARRQVRASLIVFLKRSRDNPCVESLCLLIR